MSKFLVSIEENDVMIINTKTGFMASLIDNYDLKQCLELIHESGYDNNQDIYFNEIKQIGDLK